VGKWFVAARRAGCHARVLRVVAAACRLRDSTARCRAFIRGDCRTAALTLYSPAQFISRACGRLSNEACMRGEVQRPQVHAAQGQFETQGLGQTDPDERTHAMQRHAMPVDYELDLEPL
jgi:hypothetical protein